MTLINNHGTIFNITQELSRFTQEEIDKNTESRILSDAELIKAGATVENEKLSPTHEQIEKIAEEHRFPTSALGVLALRDDLEIAAEVPIETLVQEEMARKSLGDKIDAVLEPYVAPFSDNVPPASSNERNLLRKIKTKSRQAPSWEKRKIFENVPVTYRFDLTYTPGESDNDIEKVVIGLSAPEIDRFEKYQLVLSYKEGEVSSLNLSDIYPQMDIFKKTLGGTPVGNFAAEMGEMVAITINLDTNKGPVIDIHCHRDDPPRVNIVSILYKVYLL